MEHRDCHARKTSGFSGLRSALPGVPPELVLVVRAGTPAAAGSPEEAAALAGFAHAERRRAYALGREAARSALAAVAGARPETVDLRTAADGAPVSAAGHVSIAHAGRGAGLHAVAAAFGASVGVDLEPVRARRADLHARLLGPDERGVVDALGGPTDDVQTLIWTLKEAVLKGQRTGFRAGARSVRLDVQADGAPPDAGTAAAVSERSGLWQVSFCRVSAEAFGDGWLAVAWADGA